MAVFLLLVLLLAAAAGVLGAVLKVTLVLVLSLILAVVLLAWIGAWYAKRRMRAFQRDVQIRIDQDRRRRDAYDVGPERRQDTAGQLGDGR
jgi:Flp pilus assembly protein TadB